MKGGGVGDISGDLLGRRVRKFPSVIMKNVLASLEGGALKTSHYSYKLRIFFLKLKEFTKITTPRFQIIYFET